MSRPARSFDVFDTLIARRCVEPARLFGELERRSGIPTLAAVRLAADRTVGSRGRPFTLQDIWHEVRAVLGLDEAAPERWMAEEIKLEHEASIPIVENLAQVRDGDILVSDTYLPADVVRSLLRQARLRAQVALAVSNDGKHRGWVWQEIRRRVAVAQHLGDNEHSDGRMPSEAGIPAVIYTGARRSGVERHLTEKGWAALADLIREVRLANPFPTAQPHHRHLWLLSCQFNFPLLFLAGLSLERLAREEGISEILFVSRDCLMWRQLYEALYPHRKAAYLYASRRCLLKPSESYLDYFRTSWSPGSVIVDLFSTGTSWGRLFERLDARARCFFIGLIDDYRYLPEGDALRPQDRLRITSLFRNSELGGAVNKNVEMLNYAPHPAVEDVVWLPTGGWLPVLADEPEYDPSLPEAAHQAFRCCVEKLPMYPELRPLPGESPVDLVKALVGAVCSDGSLPAAYPGHHEADAAYLRRLLE